MRRFLESEGVTAVWVEPHNANSANRLVAWGLYDGAERFSSLDLALKHVEDALLLRAQRLSEKWMARLVARRFCSCF
jgi:hypothetical protein